MSLVIAATLSPHAEAELISNFRAGGSGWHLGTIAVGNLDFDSSLEIVVPYRSDTGSWFLDAFDFNGARLAGFPYASGGEEMNVSPTIVDLDSDGRDEILITRGNKVVALQGDGSVLWSTAITSANYVPDGGYQTVTNGFWWSDGRAFRNRLPVNTGFSSQVSPPIVTDIQGSGSKLVVTGWKIDPDPTGGAQDFNPFIGQTYGYIEWGLTGETWSGGVIFLEALTGSKNFVYHLHQLVESGLAIGRADADHPMETYVLSDSDSVVCFDRTRPHGLWGKGMLHKQFGKNQQLMSGSYLAGIDIQTADIDGDGLDEVLVAGTQLSRLWQANETILDDDGAILWRRWLPKISIDNKHGWLNSACMIPVNPDGDNRADVLSFNHGYEIAFRSWDGAELVDRPGWPKNFAPYLPTPAVVGDVDGGGDQEIIIGTYNPAQSLSDGKLLIYGLDGALRREVAVPGGVKHIPALVDVNGDGGLDVIYRSVAGEIFVHNFGATGTNSVFWAAHRGNQQRDGNVGRPLFPDGTPLITGKSAGYRSASFSWKTSAPAKLFRLYRSGNAIGPFDLIATLTSNATSYTDHELRAGSLYFYQVAAVHETNILRSAPFSVMPFVSSNLLANAGFEENDNSHWDKWFTGDIPATNMLGSSMAHQGNRSMEVRLNNNNGNSGSIAQFNQYGIPNASLPVVAGACYSFGGWFRSGGISQPSEHWWEWSSDKDANTNSRPALPWPDYTTPRFRVGTNATDWVYANRVFFMPAGFPSIQFRHRFTTPLPANGSVFLDDVFFRGLPPLVSTNWTELIPFQSSWRFYTNPPPRNWYQPAFDDAAWPTAMAKFGAGSGPFNVKTRLPSRKPAYYFRREFRMDFAEPEELLLAATCTDSYAGAVYPPTIFLNGTELPTTGIEAVTGQGNEVRYYDLHPFIPLLKQGANSIAVILRNVAAADWDDVAFDLSLKAIASRAASPVLRATRSGDELWLETLTPSNTVWQLRWCDSLITEPWQVLTVFTNGSTELKRIRDNRPSPANGTRFYQLAPL